MPPWLSLPLTGFPVLGGALAVGVLLLVLLVWQRPARWRRLAAGAGGGAAAGALLQWVLLDEVGLVPVVVQWPARAYFVAACAAVGLALASLGRGRRRILALLAIPAFALIAALGINAQIGLTTTLGAVLGSPTAAEITLPPRLAADPGGPGGSGTAPASRWQPPSDLPAVGRQGTYSIPAPVSGFTARPAGIYLPPAALVAAPPALPLVIMLMGQPGAPDPQFIGAVLDRFAAAHQGLAPIVVVADQIGPAQQDTLCLDSAKYGKVESYLMDDVVGFARDRLNILPGPQQWVIAGYSNGGQCAISLGAKHPEVFGTIVDISGEAYPGAENPARNLAEVFGGDQGAYDAQKPAALLARGQYPDTRAIFTAGSDDTAYVATARMVAAAAAAAGMDASYVEVPNGGHTVAALTGGLDRAFALLGPRLGLGDGG